MSACRIYQLLSARKQKLKPIVYFLRTSDSGFVRHRLWPARLAAIRFYTASLDWSFFSAANLNNRLTALKGS
jgi:hypothetical protein